MSVEETEVVDSWEEAADSGELDRQLEQLGHSRTIQQLRLGRERQEAAAAAAARAGPQERLMVRVQGDEAGRTQYVPAGPQITILKRPDSGARERRGAQERNRQPAKTLQQREAEYAEARQRILGSSGVIEKTQGSERPAPVELLRNKQQSQAVSRLPRGPDGTPGFQLRR